MRPKAFKPIPTIARIFPSRSESATSARPMVPRMSPTTYPHGRTIRRAPSGNGPAKIPATNSHPKPRMIDAQTFDGIPREPSLATAGSIRLYGAGTLSGKPESWLFCTTSSDHHGGDSSGRLGVAHAGATAGSLWHCVQTVASSGSSSAQCGHAFTLLVSAGSHDRLYRLTASIVAVGPWRERLQGSSWLRRDHGRRGRSCSGC